LPQISDAGPRASHTAPPYRAPFARAHRNEPMSRTIHCSKLHVDAEGLDFAPWPGPLGQRIYAEISKPAWQQWLAHQTTLINEYRLNPLDAKSRQYLGEQMEKFLFGGEVDQAAGFTPPPSAS
jgi:Fe-S cluster biosynthesis and repair protein YggX